MYLFPMTAGNLKNFIIVSVILIGVIIIAQLFWLNRLYLYEERQFTTNVVKSIRGLYEDLDLNPTLPLHLQQSIERPDANTFLFQTGSIPSKDSLVNYLLAEFEDFDVFAECRIIAYDYKTHAPAYSVFMPTAGSHTSHTLQKNEAETIHRDHNYISLFFPKRKNYILSEIRWWIISAVLVSLLIAGFAASLISLYRQKFLNEVQSDFIKNVTHEFQTPLTTLNLGLDMISQPNVKRQADKLDRYTSVMKAQTGYLQHHLENLVRVIRTDSLGIQLKKEIINPVSLIKQAIHQLHFLALERAAQIEFHANEEYKTITGDTSNLYLVILNIISNAIKFSEKPTVTIITSSTEKYYTISVADNGIGIEKKHHRMIFKKFFRVPTGNIHDVKGLGLGLYFSRKIIKLHGGRIEVQSQPGSGTTFTIILPLSSLISKKFQK